MADTYRLCAICQFFSFQKRFCPEILDRMTENFSKFLFFEKNSLYLQPYYIQIYLLKRYILVLSTKFCGKIMIGVILLLTINLY